MITKTVKAWAIAGRFGGEWRLLGVWNFGVSFPNYMEGNLTALFRTRKLARIAAKNVYTRFLRRVVRVTVTISEVTP